VRYNGLCLVIDMAARVLDAPLVDKYKKAILLGAIREDYWYLPLVRTTVEQPSLTHFYGPGLPGGFVPFLTPGTRTKASQLYRRALAEARAGKLAAAFVQLGRTSHLLTDMGCPVHVHRVVHETDPYEWYVESHRRELIESKVPTPPDARTVKELIEGLAAFTQKFRPDRTNSLYGRILRKAGIWKAATREEVAAQAKAIIPMAASYNVALMRLFLRESALGEAQGVTSTLPSG
jgi:hypothetical protein